MNTTTLTASKRKWPDFEHTGPGTVAGMYMRRFWQPVYVATQLAVRQTTTIKIMGELFTLFRGEGGRAQIIAPRCAHRGTLLSTGTVEGDEIRCFYHGWKYEMNGKCTERPAEGNCPADLGIKSYPTREWAGLVFGYFGEGEPPPFQKLDVLDGDGLLFATAPVRPFNYFSQMENALDEVHFNFVHRISRFAEQGMNAAIPKLSCEETDYGLSRLSVRGDVERRTHFLMPNANLALLFGAWHLVWRVPIDDTSHISFTVDYVDGYADHVEAYRRQRQATDEATAKYRPAADIALEIMAGTTQMEEYLDHPDLLSIQDTVALLGQGAIADRENETLGSSDNHIVRMRRLWALDLKSVALGKDPRTWAWPATISVTSGIGDEVSV